MTGSIIPRMGEREPWGFGKLMKHYVRRAAEWFFGVHFVSTKGEEVQE